MRKFELNPIILDNNLLSYLVNFVNVNYSLLSCCNIVICCLYGKSNCCSNEKEGTITNNEMKEQIFQRSSVRQKNKYT